MKIFTHKFFCAVILIVSLLAGCKKDDVDTVPSEQDKAAKAYLKTTMEDIYYWYSKIPTNIDTKPLNIYSCFDTLLYKTEDRWSWMETGEEYLNREQGISVGYGARIVQAIEYYNDYGLRIELVYPNSPFAQNGVQRGWELTKINGTPVMTLIQNNKFYTEYQKTTNTFTFNDLNKTEKTFTATAQTFTARSVLTSRIFTATDFPGLTKPVGYVHYLTFNAKMLSDIDEVMAQFKTVGVSNVILDLRYNGGGDGSACNYLANYLAPESANNQILSKYKHNDKNTASDNNTASILKRTSGSLNLDKLYIISGRYTASASEIIINGLKPLMNVIQVGKTTYGKPAGMYVVPYPKGNITSPDYVFYPICFLIVNKDGYGEYLNGIVPDNYRMDDVFHDFGLEEDLIHACLVHIKTGTFPALPEVVKSAKLAASFILPEQPKRFLYLENFEKIKK